MARIVKRKWVKGRGSKRVEKLEFTEDPVIKLNGEMLEKVETYKYLDQIVSTKLKDYNINKLRERIKKAYKAYFANRGLFQDRTIDIKYKGKIYLSHIRPILTYG